MLIHHYTFVEPNPNKGMEYFTLFVNQMDDFSIKPGYPNAYGLIGNEANAIESEKRMLSSMTPTIVEDLDNELYLVLGSPGGSTIITTVAQIISNVIDILLLK